MANTNLLIIGCLYPPPKRWNMSILARKMALLNEVNNHSKLIYLAVHWVVVWGNSSNSTLALTLWCHPHTDRSFHTYTAVMNQNNVCNYFWIPFFILILIMKFNCKLLESAHGRKTMWVNNTMHHNVMVQIFTLHVANSRNGTLEAPNVTHKCHHVIIIIGMWLAKC